MKFNLSGVIERELVTLETGSLYSVIETVGEKQKKWAIWFPNLLAIGSTYDITGDVSEYKDKKLKYEGGKDVWKTGFTAKNFSEVMSF